MLLEIFQYHIDQVKTLVASEYSNGTLTKYVTAFKYNRAFLQWKNKQDDIDTRKLDYEFITTLEFCNKRVQRCDHNTSIKYIASCKKMTIRP